MVADYPSQVRTSDLFWRMRRPDRAAHWSSCDCFHFSRLGNEEVAAAAYAGYRCTPETPCCRHVEGNLVASALCEGEALVTDGTLLEAL